MLDTAEAMLQLANAQEFAGNEEAANRWYTRIVKEFPNAPCAKKAGGARARLGSVGKLLNLHGKNASGGTIELSKCASMRSISCSASNGSIAGA